MFHAARWSVLRTVSSLALALTTLIFCTATPAFATVDGVSPTLLDSWRVFGNSLSIGNTLMRAVPAEPLVNSVLVASSAANVSGVPTGSTIEAAYLFWSGSEDPDVGADNTARLAAPSGASRLVTADRCLNTTANFGGGVSSDFFYCRADVTSFVQANPGTRAWNGRWTVSEVTAMPGLLGPDGTCIETSCQAMYAGWSMVVVWSNDTEPTLRDVTLFDGFQLYDETPASAGIDAYSVGGFDVANPPEATFRFFALEGDSLLGVPPQDSDPVLRCTTCFDYAAINGTKLSDPFNSANNVFNSTVPEATAIGVDIDSYTISDLVSVGDTSIQIEIGSGDGNPSTGHASGAGGGELFLVGYNLLTVNRLAPNFRNDGTFMTVDPTEAAPGDSLFYTVEVNNSGSLDATGTRVLVPLPPELEYVAGSMRLDGVAVADVGGTSPLFTGTGLSLGVVPDTGDTNRRITFRVRVRATVADGTIIRAAASITATELTEPTVTNTTIVTINAPDLVAPQKTFTDLNGGSVEPGDLVQYTITFRKSSADASAAALTFTDDLPREVLLQSVNAGAFTNASVLTGGTDGTGLVDVREITIPRGTLTASISFTVRVKNVAEFAADGVDAAAIDGLRVSNQGALDAEFLTTALLTDDPSTATATDPTVFTLSSAVNLRNTSTFKRAEDLNGGTLQPGDEIRFTISLRNSGNQAASVNIGDDLPAFLEGAVLDSAPTGVVLRPAPAGASGTGRVEGTSITIGARTTSTIIVRARVRADAPNGQRIANIAQLRVPDFPDQDQDLAAEVLTVVAAADFASATKTVVGAGGGFEPGDTVTWTVSFTNEGTRAATSVVVTDRVDANLTAIAPLDGGLYDATTRTIRWNVAGVPVGDTRTVRFTARISASVTNGTRITNQASIAADGGTAVVTDDPSTAALDDATSFVVDALPELSFEKTVADTTGGLFEPGNTVEYTLVVRNSGRAAAANVVVRDVLPAGIFDAITPGQLGALSGTTVTWTSTNTPALASIAPGASVTLTIRGTIRAGLADGLAVDNQASLTAGSVTAVSDDPGTAAVDDATRFVISAIPDLSTSTKTVVDENGGAVQPGDFLLWTITLNNTGNGAASDVIVSDILPVGLDSVTVQNGGTFNAGTREVLWTPAAAVAADGTLELNVRTRVVAGTASGTVLANQATLSAVGVADVVTDDPGTAALDDATRVTVVSRPDYATSTKEIVGGPVDGIFRPGDTVTYRIVVTNSGTEDATNVTVTDTVDPSLGAVTIDGPGVLAGDTITWTIPALAAGESLDVGFAATLLPTIDDGTVVSNQAFITSGALEPEPTDDPTTADVDDATVFTVTSRPDLSTTFKSVVDLNGAPFAPGDFVEYTIAVVNTGTSDALDVTITDLVDASLTEIDPGDATLAGSTLTWNASTTPALASLAPGPDNAISLTFRARIVDPLDNATIVSNQAELRTGELVFVSDDPGTDAASDATTFQVISSFDFSGAIKSVGPSGPTGYRPGDEIVYTIGFINQGNAAARNVVVADVLDPSLEFVSATGGGRLTGTTVRWTSAANPALVSLDPGVAVELEVRARLRTPLADGTVVANQAQVSADGAAAAFVTDNPATADVDDDATTLTVTAAAGIDGARKEVEDLDGDGVFEPGDRVRYTITVRNDGDAVATNTVVTDVVDIDNLDDIDPLDGATFDGTTLTWSPAGLPALAAVNPGDDGEVPVRFEATIRAGTPDATVVANQAFVTADGLAAVPTDDPANGLGDDNTTDFNVVAAPDLSGATKTFIDLNGGDILTGDRIEYTITVRNDGTEAATNVVVTDALSASLEAPTALDGGTISGNVVRWSIASLAVDAQVTLRFQATVAASVSDGSPVSNQALVSADRLEATPTDDPLTAAVDDPTTFVVNETPDLTTSTKAFTDLNGGFVEPGDVVRVDIVVTNTGFGSADEVLVTDEVDSTLLTDIVPIAGRLDGNVVTWDVGTNPTLASIPGGGAVELAFTATVAADVPNDTVIVNQARISEQGEEIWLTDDASTEEPSDATTLRVFFPELGLATKSVVDLNGADVEPGDRLVWSIRLGAGAGPDLNNVVVTDTLDPRLVDVVLLGPGAVSDDGRLITWDASNTPGLGVVPSGESRTLEFEATVVSTARIGELIANQAFLLSDEVPIGELTDDPRTEAEDDATVVAVGGVEPADFTTSTKSVEDLNGDRVEPGDILRWTLVLANTGIGTSSELTLIDTLPSLVRPVAATVNGEAVDITTAALAEGVALPDLEPGQSHTIVVDTEVIADAPRGAVIANQALIRDAKAGIVATDDPSTEASDDSTSIVVGESPDLSLTVKTAVPLDENGDGFVQPGESIRYTITIPNRGSSSADETVFVDELPDGARFTPGTITVDGIAMTDALDEDIASFRDGAVRVDIGTINAGQSVVIEFLVGIEGGTLLANQGRVVSTVTDDLTDNNLDGADGDGATLVAIDGATSQVNATKLVADANGDRVEPGDTLLYTLRFAADGGDTAGIEVLEQPDLGVTLVSVVAADPDVTVDLLDDGTGRIVLPALQAGQSRVVVLAATVSVDIAAETLLCNRLIGEFAGTAPEACATVGGQLGLARAGGFVFRELGVRDGLFGSDTDEGLEGFLVRLTRPTLKALPIEVLTDADGRFDLPPLVPGAWQIEAYANGGPSNGGALFAVRQIELSDGQTGSFDVLVEPSGVVYDIDSFDPIGAVTASLYYAATEPDPTLANQPVPVEAFARPSQQGQVIPGNGIYRFDAPPGHTYQIVLEPQGALAVFPSIRLPAQTEPIVVDGRVEAVAEALPSQTSSQASQYWLAFEQAVDDAGLFNNHIPIDPLDGYVSINKRADRVSSWVGDIITYTVTVSNRSTTDVVWDEVFDRGGVRISDSIPRTFRYVSGSAVGVQRSAEGVEAFTVDVDGDLVLTFGSVREGRGAPLDLPAGGEVEIRYQLVVGSETEPGDRYRNYAELLSSDGNVRLTDPAYADVRIDYDPVFDQGVLFGKVFCDTDGDGRQQRGELPLPGSRIYLDTGWYSNADEAGQYHFADIDPGLHLVKIDVNTLPTGSTLTTDERRLFNVTRGTPTVIDFGVTCVENRVSEIEVMPGDDTLAEAERLRRARFFEVRAEPGTGALDVDGVRISLLDVALAAATGDSPSVPRLMPEPPPLADEGSGEGSGAPAAAGPAFRSAPTAVDARVADGALVEPIRFALAADPGTTRWVLEVTDAEDTMVVWQQSGDGAPPATLEWDGTAESALLLAPRSNYRAVLRVFGSDARYSQSAPVAIAVAGTETRYLVNERFSGATFTRGRLPDDLAAQLDGLRSSLARTAPEPVVVESHADVDDGAPDEQADTTEANARAVARYLIDELGVDADRVQAAGRGTDVPLYPNIGDRTRQTNRRIEVRVVDPRPGVLDAPAAPPVAAPAALRANERSYAADASGVVEQSLLRPADGLVVLEVARPDGGSSAALVAVRDAVEIPGVARQVLPEVTVNVDLAGRLASIASATSSLSALDMAVTVENPVGVVARGRLAQPMNFAFGGVPDEVTAWRVEVTSEFGASVWQSSDSGAPGRGTRWTGETEDGEPLEIGRYEVRLLVRLPDGGMAASRPTPVLVVATAEEASIAEAPAVAPAAAARVRIDGVEAAPRGATFAAQIRSVSGRTVLVDVEADGARVLRAVTVPAGFSATLSPEIEFLPQFAIELPTADAATQSPIIDAVANPDAPAVRQEPARRGRRSGAPDAPGAEPAVSQPVEEAPVFAPLDGGPASPTPQPVEAEEPVDEPATAIVPAERSDAERQDPADETPVDAAEGSAAPAAPAPAQVPVPAPASDPDNPFQPLTQAAPRWLGLRPSVAPALVLQINAAQPQSPLDDQGDEAPRWGDLEAFYAREVDLALATDDGAALAELLANAAAGEINVQLPPQGVPLRSSTLPVWGTTAATNRVFINGTEVPVFDGTFNTVIELPSGASTLTVETRDVEGNRGRIEWPVEVADVRYFVLALGDTAVGNRGADIAGRNDHNAIETDSGVLLYGQARGYFRGWMNGEDVLNGYFDELGATAFVDTGRRREYEGFAREIIQPERFYPVFGDSSEPVSDVEARGKVYVLLTADESSARFGNFETDLRGIELFRYDRNLYGGQVVFNDTIAANYDTELRAHVADEDQSLTRTFNYLRGTGGSIYYLDERPVVEGSERVTLIVRDRTSGAELARVPQARNVDYTIRYSEGRLLMRSPVPSVVDDSMRLGGLSSSRSTLRGHPVFVEVAYDHEGGVGTGDLSWGVHGRETFFDWVTVGGGTVRETRDGGDYELWGVEAGVGPTDTSRIDFEYAQSRSNDLGYQYSDDGGLTWGSFRLDDGADEEGSAIFLRGRFELADVIDAERDRILGLEAYWRDQERGFFSNGTVLDQGEQKYGGLVRWNITDVHSVATRFDSSLAEVDNLNTDDLEDTSEIQRSATVVQYEYNLDPVNAVVGYQHGFSDDDRSPDGFENDIITAELQYRILRWLRMGIDHELIARGEDPRLIRGGTQANATRIEDRFITGLSLAADLPTGVELSVAERFRYSGENSTILGLRADVGDDGSGIYVQQRLSSFRDNRGQASSTVVGGEQRFGNDGSGRTYGEYHLDSGVGDDRSRAVLGFGKRWEVLRGLSFNLGYERSETLSAESNDSASSRDTASLGWEFVRLRQIKLSGLLEARFDSGSFASPQLATCLGDDITGNPAYCQDRVTSIGDRRQIVAVLTGEWKWTRDLTFMARLDMAFTRNTTLDLFEARDLEAGMGIAYRPIDTSWLNVLSRYTYLDELAPYELELDQRRRDSSHVLSLSPIYELPLRLQLVQKVAWRNRSVWVEGMPQVNNDLWLLIHRLNFHITRQWDVGVEYRFLHQSLTQDWQHGTLLEVNWILANHVRLGVGYNFSRFAEDELGDFDRDAHGVFFRVTAQY